jgi:hypothetical protein
MSPYLAQIHVIDTIHLPLPPNDAFPLFTPLGERAWAHGWDPVFLAPTDDDTAPGTVFQTTHDTLTATWIVCRRESDHSIQYARVIPGTNAGTITVTLTPHAIGATITVEYHLTALTQEAAIELARFATHYPAFLKEWETAITAALNP